MSRENKASFGHAGPAFWALEVLRASCVSFLCVALSGCGKDPPEEDWRSSTTQRRPTASSPDRLPPGELIEGAEDAFGLPVPKDMTLSQTSRKVRRFSGRVDFKQLTAYVQARITAHHAELRTDALFFDNVRIKGGDPTRVYDVTVIKRPNEQIVEVEDTTRPPATPGLTSEERWKKAGLKPHGGLIDPNGME